MTTYRTDTVPPILFENVQQALGGTSHRRTWTAGWLTSYGRQKEDFASHHIFNSVICSHKIGLDVCQDDVLHAIGTMRTVASLNG